MPNALLWGVMVALFNYVPVRRSGRSGTVLTVGRFLTFDHLGDVLLVPLRVLHDRRRSKAISSRRTHTGRSLTLNPVMIFLSMLLWGWIWGVVGALMAVPILMTVKIICDHIESLNTSASS